MKTMENHNEEPSSTVEKKKRKKCQHTFCICIFHEW